ncbi:urease accessory protein UreF [Thioclava indica]|nr:urease accessory UreF family protein [Thioclava indica]
MGIPIVTHRITTIMPETAAHLSLMQWLSPGFPTGAFAYSHGLEQAIAAGDVTDAGSFAHWLGDVLTHGAGWSDAVLLACGLRGEDLGALDNLARALAGSAERLHETVEQGAAFARAQEGLRGAAVSLRVLPIAVAEAARELPLLPDQIIALFLHSFAANLVSAAVRIVPLGQIAGQRVLAGMHGQITAIARRATQAKTTDIATSAFRAEIAAMQHETLDVRLFKT